MSSESLSYDRGECLTVLTHAPAEAVREFVEELLPVLGDVVVLKNRTGLVMLPYTDSRSGEPFHLGEVLVSEAQVQLDGCEGYGACVGRDNLQALAIAILDAALASGRMSWQILGFVAQERERQAEADRELLRMVEATRVELETF